MEVKGKHPETGETITIDISEQQYSDLRVLAKDRASRSKIEVAIDNFDLSADAKHLISKVLDVTISVGSTIIRLGQKIVEFVTFLLSKFPNATFGLIFGLLLGALVSAIPFIGSLLGMFLLPVAAAFGLANGYREDVRDNALKAKISEAVEMFAPLKGEA